MNRYQKIAWFNLVIIASAVTLACLAVTIEFQTVGYSQYGPFFLGIMVLMKFTPWMFKKPDSPGGVVEDERDNLILTRAVSFASVTFWWVFIISCFLLWLLIGPDRTMPTIVLPLMALGGATFIKTVCSIAILVQYHREAENG